MTDPAPTPWRWDGTTITDADGKLVGILAQRLRHHPELIAMLLTAPELYAMLCSVESHLATAALPETGLLLDDLRALLDSVRG